MITRGSVEWTDGSPVPGYVVEVWDSDIGEDDFVASTTTDANGRYEIDHKKRQDPKWFGERGRKGDFYIKVREPDTMKIVHRSKVHDDYEPAVLSIDVTLDPILVGYGVNAVYGTVTARYPDGHREPLAGARVVAKDVDLIADDTLGEDTVGADGSYVIGFAREDYDNAHEIGEGAPDIEVEVHEQIGGSWPRIWRTKKVSESPLPLRADIDVPAVLVRGEVRSYLRCQDDQMVGAPVPTDAPA